MIIRLTSIFLGLAIGVFVGSCRTSPTDLAEAQLSELPKHTCIHTSDTFNCVHYLSNYDGDTVTFNLPDTHPLLGNKIAVRIRGIDAPEIATKDQCEKTAGKKAQALVNNYLSKARRIDLKNISRDKYFRVVADIYADDLLLSEMLLKEKLAYKYDGKRKPANVNWCQNKK